MIATLRKVWDLGDAFTDRDAAAAPFDHLLSRESPRDPASWPDVKALPVPDFHMDLVQMGKALSTLGKTAGGGMLEHARQSGVDDPIRADRPERRIRQRNRSSRPCGALRRSSSRAWPRPPRKLVFGLGGWNQTAISDFGHSCARVPETPLSAHIRAYC